MSLLAQTKSKIIKHIKWNTFTEATLVRGQTSVETNVKLNKVLISTSDERTPLEKGLALKEGVHCTGYGALIVWVSVCWCVWWLYGESVCRAVVDASRQTWSICSPAGLHYIPQQPAPHITDKSKLTWHSLSPTCTLHHYQDVCHTHSKAASRLM